MKVILEFDHPSVVICYLAPGYYKGESQDFQRIKIWKLYSKVEKLTSIYKGLTNLIYWIKNAK